MAHKILYSLDYELFWTENSSEFDVLIKPTNHLLDLADKLGIKLTIFADVLCFIKYREKGLNEFVDQVESQLKDAIKRGHDVQSHIHPHWLTVKREGELWHYSSADFLLGCHSLANGNVYEFSKILFSQSKNYLENLLKPIDKDYRCLAFRAGGYGIQPQETQIIKALIDSGFVIDSSIVPGMKLETGRNLIDFTSVPKQGNYYLDENSGINKSASSGLYEIPVPAGTIGSMAMAKRVRRYINDRKNPATPLYGKGNSRDLELGAVADVGSLSQSINRKLKVITQKYASYHIPEDSNVLINLTQQWLKKSKGEELQFSLLIHPKGLSQKMIDDLTSFQNQLVKNWGNKIISATFLEIGNQLSPKVGAKLPREGRISECSPK